MAAANGDLSVEALQRTLLALQDLSMGSSPSVDEVSVVCADGSLSRAFELIPLPDIGLPPDIGVMSGRPNRKDINASRSWIRLSKKNDATTRQALLVRVRVGQRIGYVMELQKRTSRTDDGYRFVERFSGLAFLVADENRRRECVNFVIYQTARHRQVLAAHYLAAPFLHRPRCFKHRTDEHGGARSTLLIGLSKIGLIGVPEAQDG